MDPARATPPSFSHSASSELLRAASLGSAHELGRCLAAGSDPLCSDSGGLTPLMRAIVRGAPVHFEMLLPLSDPRARNFAANTPLMIAILHRREQMAERLLPLSDLDSRDAAGASILSLCVIHGLPELARQTGSLCSGRSMGSEPFARPDSYGMGPLMWAAKRNDVDMASFLTSFDDPARVDAQGRTALIHAIISARGFNVEQTESCAKLLAPLCPVLARDHSGLSAADHARVGGSLALASLADWIETAGLALAESQELSQTVTSPPPSSRSRRI
jgi:ankyrin repeat protein